MSKDLLKKLKELIPIRGMCNCTDNTGLVFKRYLVNYYRVFFILYCKSDTNILLYKYNVLLFVKGTTIPVVAHY